MDHTVRDAPPSGTSAHEPVVLVGAFLLLILVFTVVGVYSIKTMLPHSPLTLPGEDVIRMQRILPQGWSFFTRNPREPWRQVFRRTEGGWEQVADRQMSLQQALGARRNSRKVGAEAAWLVEEVWTVWSEDCEVDPMECLETAETAERLNNTYPSPDVCGVIGIVEQRFTPFAWRDLEGAVMPSQVMKVEVDCS